MLDGMRDDSRWDAAQGWDVGVAFALGMEGTGFDAIIAEVGRQLAERLDALYRATKAQFEDESWSQYVEGKLAALDLAEQKVREWTGAE